MKHILIIEDDQEAANLLKDILQIEGFEVSVASDGYEGTKAVYKMVPDLVILDLVLPAGDGLSVLKNLRLSIKTKAVPVVVLTGLENGDYKQKILDEGVEAYFTKPFDTQALLSRIKELI